MAKKKAAKKPTEYQALVAEHRKKFKKGPPVGTSTAQLRKILGKTKKKKTTKKTTPEKSTRGASDWTAALSGGWK